MTYNEILTILKDVGAAKKVASDVLGFYVSVHVAAQNPSSERQYKRAVESVTKRVTAQLAKSGISVKKGKMALNDMRAALKASAVKGVVKQSRGIRIIQAYWLQDHEPKKNDKAFDKFFQEQGQWLVDNKFDVENDLTGDKTKAPTKEAPAKEGTWWERRVQKMFAHTDDGKFAWAQNIRRFIGKPIQFTLGVVTLGVSQENSFVENVVDVAVTAGTLVVGWNLGGLWMLGALFLTTLPIIVDCATIAWAWVGDPKGSWDDLKAAVSKPSQFSVYAPASV